MNKHLPPSLALGLVCFAAPGLAGDDVPKGANVTLQACVIDGKDGSYVLSHVVEVGASATASASATDPTLKAMSGATTPVGTDSIYWLSSESTKLVKDHVGHKIEVTGVVTKESRGKVRVKQEPGKETKVEVQAQGKEATAKTDEPVKAGGEPTTKSDETWSMPVRRVKVASVRMIAPTCP